MKKYGILFTVLVLTAALLTGCRQPNTAPTELPPTVGPTVMPTTEPTTIPTTVAPTTEAPVDATSNTETGAAESNGTDATDTTDNARSGRIPGMN